MADALAALLWDRKSIEDLSGLVPNEFQGLDTGRDVEQNAATGRPPYRALPRAA
jgi:hypothetical protein